MVTIGEILNKASEILKNSGIDTPRLDSEVLLYSLLGVDRMYLIVNHEKQVSKDIEEMFWENIRKREKHMPVQYIIKSAEFMGLDFFVEEGVLIPRGDTEILVEEAINIYKKEFYPKNVKIMDIGTGSGAIIISLAKFIDSSILTAIDISPKALEIAKKNASSNNVENKITFYEGSLFTPIKGNDENKSYDFIISNPPYIPKDVVNTLGPNVKDYEPHLALDGGEDGLDFYREISKGAKDYLKDDGYLLFEIGYDQGEAVSNLLKKNGFNNVLVIKDLAGLDRVVLGKNSRNI